MTLLDRRRLLLGLAAFGACARPFPLLAQNLPTQLTVATLADLRRRGPASDDAPVYLRGALAPDDEGGGWFVWRAASQAADDGGCVLAPEAGKAGRWHRLFSGAVDPRWFGARGDGLADDAEPLQRAIQHHAELHLPAGVYRLSRPLDLTNLWGRRLTGAGQTANVDSPGGFDQGRLSRASTLLLDADDAPVLRLAGSGHLIERLHIMAKTRQPQSALNSYGIELNLVSRSRLSDLRIFNCATAVGIPQRAATAASPANAIFDVAFQNLDVNRFSRCGFDLRNFNGGGTGVVLHQIYMNNSIDGKVGGDVYETEHFLLGQNWAEYVLSAVHCEWSQCRQTPIRLHNCNAAIDGLHFEGVRFAAEAASIICLEGGHAGLDLRATQLYDCTIKGGPSSAPLAVVENKAKIGRTRISTLRLAPNLRSEAGRKITPISTIAGADSKTVVSGVLNESPAYLPSAKRRDMTSDE